MRSYNIFTRIIVFTAVLIGAASVACPISSQRSVHAQTTVDDLQQKIQQHNDTISILQKEIASYQTQVDEVGQQADTLTNKITSLDLSKRQLQATIGVTQNKIDETTLQIDGLKANIGLKQNTIDQDRTIINSSLRQINIHEGTDPLTTLLSTDDFSQFWNEVDQLTRFQSRVKISVDSAKNSKRVLEDNKRIREDKKIELLTLKSDLNGQKKVVEATAEQETRLLKETKNLEANYKAILADKQARKQAFEDELFKFESQLKIAISAGSIPSVGSGILTWPLDSVKITQYFGNTPFATKNPQIYNGKGHTGVDFKASIGTRVKAALDGIVIGTGNTDIVRTCYSYGKWVMIKHANGLSTLYAHLSVINVDAGQHVSTSEIIGYSGNTGYSTGPHLHFGVYATQGVRITKFENSINCHNVTIPLADPKAYLNPLSYL